MRRDSIAPQAFTHRRMKASVGLLCRRSACATACWVQPRRSASSCWERCARSRVARRSSPGGSTGRDPRRARFRCAFPEVTIKTLYHAGAAGSKRRARCLFSRRGSRGDRPGSGPLPWEGHLHRPAARPIKFSKPEPQTSVRSRLENFAAPVAERPPAPPARPGCRGRL